MDSNKHTWLKSMQNGSIGEARTKAFLIDRFWILERSVDVDGTDFIVQAKPANHEIPSTTPPKYGRVQAKFVQDAKTSVRVNRGYVVERDGIARDDFFLIIHTGDENSQEMFLLTSKDIIQESYEKNNDFVLRSILESATLRVFDKKMALDRIENSIRCVSFLRNRTYIFSSIDHVKTEFGHMLPEFKENIEYWFGTVSELFIEKKQKAFEYLLEIEDLHSQLKEFIESVDPIKAAIIAETLKLQHGNQFQDIFDENLYFGGKRQLHEVTRLKKDGALDNYVNGRKKVIEAVNQYYDDKIEQVMNGTVHTINITYNTDSLLIKSIDNSHHFNKDAPSNEFINCSPGNVTMSYRIGVLNGKVFDGSIWLMEKILEMKYQKV